MTTGASTGKNLATPKDNDMPFNIRRRTSEENPKRNARQFPEESKNESIRMPKKQHDRDLMEDTSPETKQDTEPVGPEISNQEPNRIPLKPYQIERNPIARNQHVPPVPPLIKNKESSKPTRQKTESHLTPRNQHHQIRVQDIDRDPWQRNSTTRSAEFAASQSDQRGSKTGDNSRLGDNLEPEIVLAETIQVPKIKPDDPKLEQIRRNPQKFKPKPQAHRHTSTVSEYPKHNGTPSQNHETISRFRPSHFDSPGQNMELDSRSIAPISDIGGISAIGGAPSAIGGHHTKNQRSDGLSNAGLGSFLDTETDIAFREAQRRKVIEQRRLRQPELKLNVVEICILPKEDEEEKNSKTNKVEEMMYQLAGGDIQHYNLKNPKKRQQVKNKN